jgi:hypothetical protein
MNSSQSSIGAACQANSSRATISAEPAAIVAMIRPRAAAGVLWGRGKRMPA